MGGSHKSARSGDRLSIASRCGQHEKATARLHPQSRHFVRTRPCAKIPHFRKASISETTNAGSAAGSAADSMSARNVFQWGLQHPVEDGLLWTMSLVGAGTMGRMLGEAARCRRGVGRADPRALRWGIGITRDLFRRREPRPGCSRTDMMSRQARAAVFLATEHDDFGRRRRPRCPLLRRERGDGADGGSAENTAAGRWTHGRSRVGPVEQTVL